MAASPLDHPLFVGLLHDPQAARLFSPDMEIVTMLAFEISLAQAQAEEGVIPAAAATAIGERLTLASPSPQELAAGIARDGVVGPAFVRLIRQAVGEPHGQLVHFGATSQDLVDSSLMVRLKLLAAEFDSRLQAIEAELGRLIEIFGGRPLMGRTRMRAALPITVADRIASWWGPLDRARRALPADTFAVQFGGPGGTLSDLGDAGPAVRARLARALDLADAPAWHSQRDRMVRIADWLTSIATALGKIGQDVTLMSQDGIGEIVLGGAGGSSAMAHKQNPVKGEVLVALGRHAATLMSGMHHAAIHEQERSGAAWTLEWLLLPQLALNTAAALRLTLLLLGEVDSMGEGAAHG